MSGLHWSMTRAPIEGIGDPSANRLESARLPLFDGDRAQYRDDGAPGDCEQRVIFDGRFNHQLEL
jgi:hypothetical protein